MEPRKQIEKKHYNKKIKNLFSTVSTFRWENYGHKMFKPILSTPFQFIEKTISDIIPRIERERVKLLDYGCGIGIHSIFPATQGAYVYGIDISEESIKFAREWAHRIGVEKYTNFSVMDCEHLEFPDNSFDIILDGGTFSSLDLDKALSEIARILRPNGKLIGIETLGHNPLTNLKRRLNFIRGKRTKWAAEHIFKVGDFNRAQKYFGQIKVKYFHLTVLLAMPFRKTPGIMTVIKILDKIDALLLKIPFLKKYAFKIVFVFSDPKKS